MTAIKSFPTFNLFRPWLNLVLFDVFIGDKLFRYVTDETPRILNVLTGKFISDMSYVWVFNRFSLLKVSSWLRESVSPDTIASVVLEAKRNRTLMSSCLVDGLRNCKVNMRQSIFIDLLFNLISQGFTAMELSVAIEILKLHNFIKCLSWLSNWSGETRTPYVWGQ